MNSSIEEKNSNNNKEYKNSLIMCGVCGVSAIISFYVTLKTSGQIFEPIAGFCAGMSMTGLMLSGLNSNLCKSDSKKDFEKSY